MLRVMEKKRIRRTCGRVGKQTLIVEFYFKRNLGFLRICRDTIKVNVDEMGSEFVNCIEMNQNRFQWAGILL
jgi:hypothetical protein